MTNIIPAISASLSLNDQLAQFADFVRINVAEGDASPDTVRAYHSQVARYVQWTRSVGIDPATATETDILRYRRHLITQKYLPSSIATYLTAVRRFYQSAVKSHLRLDNPAKDVRSPRDKRPVEDFHFLTAGEVDRLFATIPPEDTLVNLRNRCIVAIMHPQAARTVEVHRANVEDLQLRDVETTLYTRGKMHDRLIHLTPDVLAMIDQYLEVRGEVGTDSDGTPLFVSFSPTHYLQRLSRRGTRFVVDGLMRNAGIKRKGISCHALRHTAATQAYQETRDLRAVQEMLGHQDPKTTARYAKLVDAARNNPALAIKVNFRTKKQK